MVLALAKDKPFVPPLSVPLLQDIRSFFGGGGKKKSAKKKTEDSSAGKAKPTAEPNASKKSPKKQSKAGGATPKKAATPKKTTAKKKKEPVTVRKRLVAHVPSHRPPFPAMRIASVLQTMIPMHGTYPHTPVYMLRTADVWGRPAVTCTFPSLPWLVSIGGGLGR